MRTKFFGYQLPVMLIELLLFRHLAVHAYLCQYSNVSSMRVKIVITNNVMCILRIYIVHKEYIVINVAIS